MVLGHDISIGHRTQDVQISENISFDTMMLNKTTVQGLSKAGFSKPSPIQLHGIPLGKCGFDLLLEAKSGTGKTAVFTVISLEKLDLMKGLQTIILAPTREIASQISDVIAEIGAQYEGLNVAVVMGGLPIKEDIEKFKENVHIAVGSPGRMRHLIQDKHIDISCVRLFVLDEADKLMENSFLPDINYIYSLLPKQKQVIMSSATYSEETKSFVQKYVQNVLHICPDTSSVLLGISQKVVIVPCNANIVKQTKYRYEELKKILNGKQFKQCLIFCNYQVRVGEVHRMLTKEKWPAEQLYGQQNQNDRLDALKTLQEYKCRILVSTDLAARGIDASNVDLVINFEPPNEWETYLHRIGRAGRYGTYGMAISILSNGKEVSKFKETLAVTNIPFDIHDLWSDEIFSLNMNNTHNSQNKDKISVTSIANEVEDKQINILQDTLWKILTLCFIETEDDTKAIPSFEELCRSFEESTEPCIESFTDLVHSFETFNCSSNVSDHYEYKCVEAAKFEVDLIKYSDIIENLNTNKECKDPHYMTGFNENQQNNTNVQCLSEECKENERYLTERMEKDVSSGFSNHCTIQRNIENSMSENTSVSSTDSKVEMLSGNNKDKPKCLNMDSDFPIPENDKLISNIGHVSPEPSTSGQNKLFNDNNSFDKYYDSGCKTNDHVKQALLEAGLPTAFGKKKQARNNYKRNTYGEHSKSKDANHTNKTIKHNKNSKKNDYIVPSLYENVGEDKKKYKHCKNIKIDIETLKGKQMQSNYKKTTTFEDSLVNDDHGYTVNSHINNTERTVGNQTGVKTAIRNKDFRSTEEIRNKRFNLWYSHLRQLTYHIQQTLYIEELRKF